MRCVEGPILQTQARENGQWYPKSPKGREWREMNGKVLLIRDSPDTGTRDRTRHKKQNESSTDCSHGRRVR